MNIFGLRRTHKSPKKDYNWSHSYINSLGNEVKCIIVKRFKDDEVAALNEHGCTVLLDEDDLIVR